MPRYKDRRLEKFPSPMGYEVGLISQSGIWIAHMIDTFPSPMGNEVGLIFPEFLKTGPRRKGMFPSPMGIEVGLIQAAPWL